MSSNDEKIQDEIIGRGRVINHMMEQVRRVMPPHVIAAFDTVMRAGERIEGTGFARILADAKAKAAHDILETVVFQPPTNIEGAGICLDGNTIVTKHLYNFGDLARVAVSRYDLLLQAQRPATATFMNAEFRCAYGIEYDDVVAPDLQTVKELHFKASLEELSHADLAIEDSAARSTCESAFSDAIKAVENGDAVPKVWFALPGNMHTGDFHGINAVFIHPRMESILLERVIGFAVVRDAEASAMAERPTCERVLKVLNVAKAKLTPVTSV